jgi:ABC-type uncharacterized transport system auxiliary subunit
MTMRPALLVLALALVVAGCSDEDTPMETFDGMVESGATCQELVQQRLEFEPAARELGEVNRILDEIGCENGQRDDLP